MNPFHQVYNDFLIGRIDVAGNDLCDMSGASDRTPQQFTVYNVMLPRTYCPSWQGTPLRRAYCIFNTLEVGDPVE